jgi:Uma2 family endonuclease
MAVLELVVPPAPRRKLWTRKEYDRLSSSGLLHGQRLELIEGDLIDKMGKNPRHVNSVTLLLTWLLSVFGPRRVYQEAPIDVAPEDNPTNEPEPDLVVLARDMGTFANSKPGPRDLQLVIEVAESTLGFDLKTKAGLYARAGIVEYWVLDLAARRMIVHRAPQNGHYVSITAYVAEESVAPLAAPESVLPVRDAFLD